MNNVLRLAIVDPCDATRDALKTMLLGLDMIWLEAESHRYEFFADVIDQTNPDIAIIALDSEPESALQLIEHLNENSHDCAVFAFSASTDGDLILRAMRAGAKEFLTRPLKIEELIKALGRLSERKYGKDQNKQRGNAVIAVAGATGGVGGTSIAVNLAAMLARDPKKSVVMVDLDLSLGDADVFLDTIPDYTIIDVAQNVSRLDFSLLKRSLTKHSSGLYLLPRPVQMEDIPLITPDNLRRVIGLLQATFTHVVIDLSKGYTANDLVAMEAANKILLVTQMDLPCLRNVVRLLTSFRELDGIDEKVHVVVNRVGLGDGQISMKKAQETIGRDIYWRLTNDYRMMVEVRNNGVPLYEQAPKAALTQEMASLAEAVCGDEMPQEAQAGKSSFGKLFGFFAKEKAAK